MYATVHHTKADGVGGMLSSNSVHSGIHNSDMHEHTSDVQSSTSQYNITNDTKKKHVSSSGILGKSSAATHANALAAKHIISILDTVSMLMSRQIRGTVERSLR
jgi:hypothetical protein